MDISDIIIRQPATEKEWKDYFELRWSILRRPWGIIEEPEPDEKDSYHLGAFSSNGKILAAGRLVMKPDDTGQVRSMAVLESCRGMGLGRLILIALEEKALEENISRVILQARESAVKFYEKSGYRMVEKSFLLQGAIQHYLMERIF